MSRGIAVLAWEEYYAMISSRLSFLVRYVHSPCIQLKQNTPGKLLLVLMIAEAIEFALLGILDFHHAGFVLHDN